VEGTGK